MNFFLTIVIFIIIGVFGFFDFQTDYLLGSFHTFDITVISINIVFFISYFNNRLFQNYVNIYPNVYLKYFYLFVLIVMITMPLRGDITIFESVRVGSHFLIIPIYFLISWQCKNFDNQRYFKKIFVFISIITSLQIIVNAIEPSLISETFPFIRARLKFKYEFQRNDFISKSMLFPHFACLLFFDYLKSKIDKYTLYLFLLFFLASGLQGFRSYFAILVVAILFRFLKSNDAKTFFRFIRLGLISLIIVLSVDSLVLNNQVYNKVATIPLDFINTKGSTTKGRVAIDLIYSLPKFTQSPIFGWGFIHYSSKYGKSIGLRDTQIPFFRPYTLYSIDSGYLSLLNMFGLFGVFILVYLYIKFIFNKFKKSEYSFLAISSFALIFLSLPTHGAFYSDFGLLPFLFILAISNHTINRKLDVL